MCDLVFTVLDSGLSAGSMVGGFGDVFSQTHMELRQGPTNSAVLKTLGPKPQTLADEKSEG